MSEHETGQNPDRPGPNPDWFHARPGPDSDQSGIGPDSCRTGTPLYRVRSGPRPDSSDEPETPLDRYRRSGQLREIAEADPVILAAAWEWLTTPDEEQRAICTATHYHRGPCPKVARPVGLVTDPRHRCHHNKPCPARHHRQRLSVGRSATVEPVPSRPADGVQLVIFATEGEP